MGIVHIPLLTEIMFGFMAIFLLLVPLPSSTGVLLFHFVKSNEDPLKVSSKIKLYPGFVAGLLAPVGDTQIVGPI